MFQALGVEVNILGMLLAVVANMLFGTIWYGPLFGNLWLKLTGKKKDQLEMKTTDLVYAVGVALLMVVGLNSVLQFAKEISELSTIANVFLTPAMIAFTLTAPALFNEVIWEGRSAKLILFNLAHQYFTFVVMSVVLAFFVL